MSFLSVKVYAVGFYADISNVDFAVSDLLSFDVYILNARRSCQELPPDQRIDWLIQNRAVAVRLGVKAFSTCLRLC